jgi:KDO2-lipid IV(A) lauroyltransferase
MQLLAYILLYPLLWLFSILPMRVLFILSDIIYVILYYLIGYRKKVVRHNLRLAFPEKSAEELKVIEKKSFQHFVDIFMEMIKSFTITEKELAKRLCITNPELPDAYFDKNQSVIFLSGHYANWEWVSFIVETSLKYHMSVVYKKLSNTYFDDLIKRTRNKFGVKFVPAKEFYPEILTNLKNHKIQAYGILADQSPKWEKIKYWGTFMGKEVPIVIGPETIAKKLDLPVFYFRTERIKRGVYQSTFILLEDHSKQAEPHQITNKYILELEKQIRKDPEFYFWTHRRFKHMGKKPA